MTFNSTGPGFSGGGGGWGSAITPGAALPTSSAAPATAAAPAAPAGNMASQFANAVAGIQAQRAAAAPPPQASPLANPPPDPNKGMFGGVDYSGDVYQQGGNTWAGGPTMADAAASQAAINPNANPYWAAQVNAMRADPNRLSQALFMQNSQPQFQTLPNTNHAPGSANGSYGYGGPSGQ